MSIFRYMMNQPMGSPHRRDGFTLVELMVVVVVLITLMTITFRLSSIGSDSTARNKTVDRMNRLENCLSGYFAAFGSYPPVAVHGYRNVYLQVNSHGIQNPKQENKNIWGWYKDSGNHGIGTADEIRAWRQVRAACKSQPVACRFPFSGRYNEVLKAYSQMYQEQIQSNPNGYSTEQKNVYSATIDNGWTDNPGRHNRNSDKVKWEDVQLFQFGLMSFLLPRYLVMLNFGYMDSSARSFADTILGTYDDEDLRRMGQDGDGFRQWKANNTLPHDPLTGRLFQGWVDVFECVSAGQRDTTRYPRVSSIPSQAATARWLPNLEGVVTCASDIKLYGIDIKDKSDPSGGLDAGNMGDLEVYTPDGFESDSTAQQYMLDKLTIRDGWGTELFYYSPAPYQTYTVWSAGKNGRTFPSWISKDKLDANAARCVGVWTADDIMRMKAEKSSR